MCQLSKIFCTHKTLKMLKFIKSLCCLWFVRHTGIIYQALVLYKDCKENITYTNYTNL